MRYQAIGFALALLLGTVTAGADDHHHGREHDDSAEGEKGEHGHHHHGDAGEDDDEDEKDEKEGTAPEVTRTPEQADFRDKLLVKEHMMVHDEAKAHGRHIEVEDREAIGLHWRHVMRLLRIRELAQADKDAAIVAKCDALLAKADARFHERMMKNAPVAGGAASAAAGAKAAPGASASAGAKPNVNAGGGR